MYNHIARVGITEEERVFYKKKYEKRIYSVQGKCYGLLIAAYKRVTNTVVKEEAKPKTKPTERPIGIHVSDGPTGQNCGPLAWGRPYNGSRCLLRLAVAMALASGSGGGGSDFSVVVLGSDFAVDAGAALLSPADRVEWHDCLPDLPAHAAEGDDFSDLDELQVVRIQGTDRAGRCVVRVVGKFFPAPVIGAERLKRYVFHKLRIELPEGPFCILYMHSTVQSDDNNPGMSILRGIYEELPPEYKERLQILYFLHPGIRSRLAIATLGRLFLSGGLYWKIKYVSRLEYLWGDIKKGKVEIPDFVIDHDKVLEHRPLTDYGIEPDPLHLADVPAVGYSLGRYEDKWSPEDRWYSRNYM